MAELSRTGAAMGIGTPDDRLTPFDMETHQSGSSQAVTHDVRVTVESRYVPERSDRRTGTWFFAYTITITNEGPTTVQLLSRRWIITDAHGEIEEIVGPGVVGEQPVLEPGQSFRYGSFCPLSTPFGTMEGSYRMSDEDGRTFDVEVACFELFEPIAFN